MNIEIKGEEVIIDGEKYVREPKPEEPEIEKGRLVCGEIEGFTVYGVLFVNDTPCRIINGKNNIEAYNIKPVNRRWGELTEDEKAEFDSIRFNDCANNKYVFNRVIHISSGEYNGQ